MPKQTDQCVLQQHNCLAVDDLAVRNGGHCPTIALELIDHPQVAVILIGGRLFKHSVVAVGAVAIEAISGIRAVVPLDKISCLITERTAPPALTKPYREMGIRVVRVP